MSCVPSQGRAIGGRNWLQELAMADINSKTRLSPPLMHAFRAAHAARDAQKHVELRNEQGDRVIAGRRLRPRQVITEAVLRQEVSRDLDNLLNAVALESTIDMTNAPYVRKSIINFGIPDITHRTIDENRIDDIPMEIKEALINFEPRLAAASINVTRDTSVDTTELKVRFVVRADLTCDPIKAPVEFVAEVTDVGKIIVTRL
jgi:type VI secretion system protein ImpF